MQSLALFPDKTFSEFRSFGQLNLTLKQEIQKKETETYCFRHFVKLMSNERIKIDIVKVRILKNVT